MKNELDLEIISKSFSNLSKAAENDYLEIFALKNHKIQKIVVSFDLGL